MTANATQYYGKARYFDTAAEVARQMGNPQRAAELVAERDRLVAEDVRDSKKLFYRILPFLQVVGISGLLAGAAWAFNSVPETQFAPDGRMIVHLEEHRSVGVDPCNSAVFALYENGKPYKCPTPAP